VATKVRHCHKAGNYSELGYPDWRFLWFPSVSPDKCWHSIFHILPVSTLIINFSSHSVLYNLCRWNNIIKLPKNHVVLLTTLLQWSQLILLHGLN
jgi:hypothetical protein